MAAVRPRRSRPRRLRPLPAHPGRRPRGGRGLPAPSPARWSRTSRWPGPTGRAGRRCGASAEVTRSGSACTRTAWRSLRRGLDEEPRRRGGRAPPGRRSSGAVAVGGALAWRSWRLGRPSPSVVRRCRTAAVRGAGLVDAPPARLVPPGHARCCSPSRCSRSWSSSSGRWLARVLRRPVRWRGRADRSPPRDDPVIELPLLVALGAGGPSWPTCAAWAVVHAGTGYAAHRLPPDAAGDHDGWLLRVRRVRAVTLYRRLRRPAVEGPAPGGRRPLRRRHQQAAPPGLDRGVHPRDPPGRARPLVGPGRRPVFALWNPPSRPRPDGRLRRRRSTPRSSPSSATTARERNDSSRAGPAERRQACTPRSIGSMARSRADERPRTSGEEHAVGLGAAGVVIAVGVAEPLEVAEVGKPDRQPAVDVHLVDEEVRGAVGGDARADPPQRLEPAGKPSRKSANATTEKQSGKRSLRSNRPSGGAWWLRCQPMPGPCITQRWPA